MHRQKVAEVEKLTQTVRELEEAIDAECCGCWDVVRDYQCKIQEMNEERKTLDKELACAKVPANRVVVVEANEKIPKLLIEKFFLEHQTGPHSRIFSIEDEPRKGIDSNNGFSLSDCEKVLYRLLPLIQFRHHSSLQLCRHKQSHKA